MLNRLVTNWVYGGFLAGLMLLVLTPVLAREWPLALTLVFLAIPAYMLHQYEEHDGDRFHRAINPTFGGGRDVLPSAAIFVINVPVTWGVNAVAFLLASVDPGWGLISLYTLVANAVVHVVPALLQRAYNPGLATALALFLPLGLFGASVVIGTGAVTPVQHAVAAAVAIGAHLAIVVYVLANRRRLAGTPG
jgi:hypothetical protein